MTAPRRHLGLHHVALFTRDLDASRRFWVDVMGYRVEWEPDADNCYLTSGADNLALHRGDQPTGFQRLDHIGVIVADAVDIEAWHGWLLTHGVTVVAAPKRHRDGATSLYCRAPDGLLVQIIHHPPIVPNLAVAARTPHV